MGGVPSSSTKNCPDLLAGEDCKTSWIIEFGTSYNVVINTTLVLLILVLIPVLVLFGETVYRTWSAHREWGFRAFKGPGLRIRTILSFVVALAFEISFYALGANLKHSKSKWEGKLTISLGACGIAFLLQTVGYVNVLYISTCNNKLSERRTFLEKVDVRKLKRFAAPWVLHGSNLVVLSLLWAGSLGMSQAEINQLLTGLSLTATVPCVYLAFIYYRKLAKILESLSEVGDSSFYETLAIESRLMAYFHLIFGFLAITISTAAIVSNILTVPLIHLVLQGGVGLTFIIYSIGFIFLFSNGSLIFGGKKQTSRKKTSFLRKPSVAREVRNIRSPSYGSVV